MPFLLRFLHPLLRSGPGSPVLPPFRRRDVRWRLEAALSAERFSRALNELCHEVGPRPNGSLAYAEAVAWAHGTMARAGLKNIQTQEVLVPHWHRNREWAELHAPEIRPIPVLGLGLSVPTPESGLSAELLPVSSFAELESLPRHEVEGRIVLLDIPAEHWEAWAQVRVLGPSAAARCGAGAVLLRSFSAGAVQPLRTGSVVYEFGVPEIPAAAVSAVDAEALHRLGRGARVHLHMGSRRGPDTYASNLLGEIPGREKPEEVVLLYAHLDSWDVGHGAQDNGVGCVMVLEVLRALNLLGHGPRRTIRGLLAAGGVTGAQGVKAYLEASRGGPFRHVAVIEVDGGSGPAQGFLWAPAAVDEDGRRRRLDLRGLGQRLASLGASRLAEARWGWDVDIITSAGIPALFLDQALDGYFEVLHSPEDRLEAIRLEALPRNAAILALAAHFLAEEEPPAG